MAAYQNTRDILGDDATLAGLVMDTLTEFVEDGVTTVAYSAFFRKPTLQMVRLPSLTSLAGNQFNGCTNLKHLLLDYNGIALYNSTALESTPTIQSEGAVYVPENQVSAYKNNSSWKSSGIVIASIDEYPLTVFESIKDDWDTILSSDGSAYSIGDTKILTLTDGSDYKMQIAYKGEGGSILTWLGRNIREKRAMYATDTTSGGWEECPLRTDIRGDGFYNLIPTNIRNHIVAVDKTYSDYTTGQKVVKSCSDTVWVPSAHEILNDSIYEDTGVTYNELFSGDANYRIKYLNRTASVWMLRSAHSKTGFRGIHARGGSYGLSPTGDYGLVVGFCTGN